MIGNSKTVDTVKRERSNLIGDEFQFNPKQKHINKTASNVVGSGLGQPDIKIIKTGRSRPTPTRHKTKYSHYPNSFNNNHNSIINSCRCNTKYDNGRKWNNI